MISRGGAPSASSTSSQSPSTSARPSWKRLIASRGYSRRSSGRAKDRSKRLVISCVSTELSIDSRAWPSAVRAQPSERRSVHSNTASRSSPGRSIGPRACGEREVHTASAQPHSAAAERSSVSLAGRGVYRSRYRTVGGVNTHRRVPRAVPADATCMLSHLVRLVSTSPHARARATHAPLQPVPGG
eukprot:1587965-Prymnesium_polylepis.2